MRYEVRLLPSALKGLERLPKKIQAAVYEILVGMEDEPRPPGVKPLKGVGGLFRLRVGGYRIIYSINDRQLLVLVVRVGHRKDAYRNL